MSIRCRLTLFIALAIGAILLVFGVALFFLLQLPRKKPGPSTRETRGRAAGTRQHDRALRSAY